MRLHQLEVTAFGPFASTVTVDFERLSDAGLFLLSGATGAGKTSVLDAICFALYGEVPGDRATAKRLRSDQADDDLAPRVTLDVTLSGRHFRLVRSPAWSRPKKRGHGTTTEPAHVTLAERIDGGWVTLSTRLDEVGHLVSLLVGMNLTQFTQVAMLPQGRFQAFLRARSEDRHRLLHQLFRTGRFEAVEGWLRDRRVALRREGEATHRDLADLVSRISEAVTVALPAGWDVGDLTAPAVDGTLHGWADELVLQCRAAVDSGRAGAQRAGSVEAAARAALEAARALAVRRDAIDRAMAQRTELDEQAPAVDRLRVDLDAARRAATVQPVARLAAAAERDLARARAGAEAITADRAELAAAEQAAVEAAAAARALLPREAEQRALSVQIAAAEDRLARLPRLRRALELRALISAGQEHQRLTAAVGEAREAHLVARTAALDLGEELVSLRQARIDGMAAELAGRLAVGGSCPVCGSADHPQPAVASPGAPDDVAERAAVRALDDAKAVEHLRAVERRDLDAARAATEQRRGDQSLEELRRELARLDVQGGEPTDDAALALEEVELTTTLAHRREQRDQAGAEVAALLVDQDAPGLAALVDHEQTVARLAHEDGRALDDLVRAGDHHDQALAALDEAVTTAGFDSARSAADAVLPARRVDELTARVGDHDRRSAAADAALAAPDVEAVLAQPRPDVPILESVHRQALDTLGRARAGLARWEAAAHRIGVLTGQLDAALGRWRPLHDQLTLVTRLSSFCEGKSADNRLQMRLSAYVLAYRLTQVVAAANVRLARMSDQRYALEHTAEAGAGETRGGLSLLVRDAWSGEARDPATLSGGETFVVSLALALGLSDVITQEAGGADLDTLFVDEGFGSLDADTLDDVLDTLDALRDGGRVVGVVSHVAEMRDRIPTQLVVTKAREGSTVAVRG